MKATHRAWLPVLLLLPGVFLLGWPGNVAGGGGMNPNDPGLPLVDNVYNRTGIPNNGASAMCVSCHTASPLPGKTTHFVSHYSRDHGVLRTTSAVDKAAKERVSAWTGSARASRYGQNLATNPSSDNSSTGDLICESCHNMLRNVAGGNNLIESSLLSDVRPAQPNTLTSTTTTLCEGCHTAETLSPVSGLLGHHPMTGDTLSSGAPLSTVDTVFTRGFVDDATEMGGGGSEVRYPAANMLPCLSCHGNGHNGYTTTGARILRKGFSRDPSKLGAGVSGADIPGIDRQYDIDPSGVNRLITNSAPLCDACHKYDD